MTPRRTLTRTRTAGVAICIALLAACGGGGDSASDDTTTTADSAAAQAALQARLIAPEDLATGDALDVGWEVGDVSDGVDIQLPTCVEEAAAAGSIASATAKLVQKTSLHLPSLQETLSSFGRGGAAKAFDAAAERLNSCDPTFVFQGATSVGKIERLEIGAVGDRSQAWRTTVSIGGAEVNITNVHAVYSDTEVALVHVTITAPPVAEIDAVTKAVFAKLA